MDMHIFRRRIRAAVVPLAAMLAALCCACGLLPVEEEAPPAPVIRSYEAESYKYTTVQRGDVAETLRISCSYTPAKKQQLSFAESGVTISAVYVAQGDAVKTGDLLAELDRAKLAEQIDSYEYTVAQLRLARAQLAEDMDYSARAYDIRISAAKDSGDRTLAAQLTDRKASVDSTYAAQRDIYTARIKSAQEKLEELKRQDAGRVLTAPFDGTVTAVKSSAVGSLSVADEAFITVSDKSTSVFTVSGENAAYFEIGNKVELTVSSTVYQATVVDPADYGVAAEENVRYIALDEYAPDLKDNTTGSVTFVTEERRGVLWLSTGAVTSANGKSFVYVMSDDNIKTVKYIETGFSAAGRVEILSGLEEGEQVIVQ